jgi:two-component system alkaline phosphatase synthesis response regulator PhoP
MAMIMVVDDEPDILAMVEMILSRKGYETVLAEGGEEALELIKQRKPDLILLDLMMPRMDGTEFLRIIRSDENLRDIPVIVVSVRSTIEKESREAMELADDYITKPIDIPTLYAAIEEMLKGKRS